MAVTYLAMVFPPRASDAETSSTLSRVEARTGLSTVAAFGRVRVLAKERTPSFVSDCEDGILLGYGFQSTGAGSQAVNGLDSFGNTEVLKDWWGGFLAIAENLNTGPVQIVRDPSGIVPCYHTERMGTHLLASEPQLLVKAGYLDGYIDRTALLRFMISDQMRPSRTCLKHLEELLAGTRMTLPPEGRPSFTQFWSPWRLDLRDSLILDETEAIERLRVTVDDCVRAWSSRFGHILLNLSGGLDSSIVAGALPDTVQATCLTLVTAGPSGDERVFARQMAERIDRPLVEKLLETSQVDLAESAGGRFPRPTLRSFAQAGDAHGLAAAREAGADAFFNGGGGDNVFCYLQSGAPIADRLLVEGVGSGTLRTISDMSVMAKADLWTVAKSGLRKRFAHSPSYRWPVELSFLCDEAREEAEEASRHLWLDPPQDALPGTASHVALLLRIQNHLDSARSFELPVISPLLSQPIVELCLRIPTWFWCRKGRNRYIARQAFADRLPAALLNRLSKGTPDSFVASLFGQERAKITDMLSEGILAQQDLLDVQKIRASINGAGHGLDADFWRLMRLVDVEAWARTWRFSRY